MAAHKDGSMVFRDTLISETGQWCSLRAPGLMKETGWGAQSEEEVEKEE